MNQDAKPATSDELWEHFMGKYQNPNPIARYLTNNFFQAIGAFLTSLPQSATILEVGCGPGESTHRVLKYVDDRRFEASEYEQALVDLHQQRGFPVPIRQESVYELQRGENAFSCVLLLEVLEHLDNYQLALQEIFRVARDSVIISVPNEPIWRVLNFLRGKYWSDWGNTPGHINHWSAAEFIDLVSNYGEVISVTKPLPWTIIKARPF